MRSTSKNNGSGEDECKEIVGELTKEAMEEMAERLNRDIGRLPPIDTIQALIKIRNNKTGKVHSYYDNVLYDKDDDCISVYIWEFGNYSCDCNRQLFFDGTDAPCSDGRFSVNIISPITGEFYYKEF